MQNWSCMHLCGLSSVKFLWSCDARTQDSFPLFQSTQCFQKYTLLSICAFISVYLGCSEKFSQHLPFKLHTHFFQKLVMISEFFQRKVGNYLFSQAWCFLARQLFIFFYYFLFSFLLFLFLLALFSFFSLFYFLVIYHLFISSSFFFFLFFSLKKSCRRGRTLPTHV